jgi:hypothetical protein
MKSNAHISNHQKTLEQALNLFKPANHNKAIGYIGKIVGIDLGFRANELPSRFFDYPYIFSAITHDFWNISNLVTRLEWQRKMSISNPENEGYWFHFAALDIEGLYIQFRSLCDYIATLIYCCFEEVDSKNYCSLKKLITHLYQNQDSFPDRTLVEIFRKSKILVSEENFYTTWFGHMREIRDNISHSGSDPIVFGAPKDGILFQVYKSGFKGTIPRLPHIKHNENVVFFDKYFALQFSNLLLFIEDISCYISEKYNLHNHNAISTSFDTVYYWISNFNEELKISLTKTSS